MSNQNKPKNISAIERWIKSNRPDLIAVFDRLKTTDAAILLTTDAAILLLTVGFESGRQFQSENQSFPLNKPHLYLS